MMDLFGEYVPIVTKSLSRLLLNKYDLEELKENEIPLANKKE